MSSPAFLSGAIGAVWPSCGVVSRAKSPWRTLGREKELWEHDAKGSLAIAGEVRGGGWLRAPPGVLAAWLEPSTNVQESASGHMGPCVRSQPTTNGGPAGQSPAHDRSGSGRAADCAGEQRSPEIRRRSAGPPRRSCETGGTSRPQPRVREKRQFGWRSDEQSRSR